MFKIDENYSDWYDVDATKYPGGMAINSSGVDTTDGTPWLAKMFNNCIGWMQALYIKAFGSLAGISNEPENVEKSDIVRALEKIQSDNNASERATSDEKYFPFAGGTVDGDVKVTGDADIEGTLNAGETTIDGDLKVNGNIVEQGESYETHAEQIYTKSDLIVARDGAVGALGDDEYSGILVRKANGTDDVAMVVDRDGQVRVGKYSLVIVYSSDGVNFFTDPTMTTPATIPSGVTPQRLEGEESRYYYAGVNDTQPLATRDPVANMVDGYGVTWDAASKSFKTTFIPSGAVVPTNIAGDTTVESVVADRCFYITSDNACTFTLGDGGQVGVKVRIINVTKLTHTLSCNSVSVNVPHILPMANVEIIWNGSAWQNISGEQVGSTWVQRAQQESPFDVFPCSAWEELVKYNGAFERSANCPERLYSPDGVSFARDVNFENPVDISGMLVLDEESGEYVPVTVTDTGETAYNSKGELLHIYAGDWTSGNADDWIEKTGELKQQKAQLPNITGTVWTSPGGNQSSGASGAFRSSTSIDGSGLNSRSDYKYYNVFNASNDGASTDVNGDNVYADNGEVRTANYSVRIWKRTA